MSTGYESNYPTTGYGSDAQLRNEFQKIKEALDDTISRTHKTGASSTDNAMHKDLSLDGNDILNVGIVSTEDLHISGVGVQESFLDLANSVSELEENFQETSEEIEGYLKNFENASGIEALGNYAEGVVITGYNQVLRGLDGLYWTASSTTSLPYTTTGEGVPEDGALTEVEHGGLWETGRIIAAVSKGIDFGVSTVTDAATDAADTAVDAAQQATQARDDILNSTALNGYNIFESVSEGLLATVDSDLFWVYPNEDNGLDNLVLYKNETGGATLLLEQYNLNAFMIEEGENWDTEL